MSDQRPIRDSMSFEEAMISNMWEIATIVVVRKRDEKRRFNELVCRPHRV